MIYSFVKAPPINTVQLTDEITTSGLPAPTMSDSEDVNLSLTFSVELDGGQQATLASVVSAHTPTLGYQSIAMRAAVVTLTGYLNNADPNVANTARAVMIANIAPNLPGTMLSTINSQIAARLGQ